MARIRMLLVDDNLDFRKGVAAWLADDLDACLVGGEHTLLDQRKGE